MFCTVCGHELERLGVICPYCRRDPISGEKLRRVRKEGYYLTPDGALWRSWFKWAVIGGLFLFFGWGYWITFGLGWLALIYGFLEGINNYSVLKADGPKWVDHVHYEWERKEE